MKTKALSRDDRKRQILMAFSVEIQNGYSGEMTVADIARKMHLSPSSKLRDMVLELVIDGILDFRDEAIPGITKFRRIYSPNPDLFRRPPVHYIGQGRAIKVNSRQGSFMELVGE